MSKTIEYTFGTDPEAFILNKKTNKIVNAVDIIPFDKHNPIDLGDGFTFFRDCCSVEGNIPPARSKKEFVDSVYTLWDKVTGNLGKDTYDISFKASHIFNEEELTNPESHVLGCSPFFLSRTVEMAEPPQFEGGVRASGFHIAVGRADFQECSDDAFLIDPMSKINVISTLDLFVGIPSIIFDNGEDAKFRNSLYPFRAGVHRPTPFGAEYRPLSSSCMRSKELVELIFDLTYMGVEAAEKGKDFGISNEEVFECMNKGNENLSKEVMKKVLPDKMIKRVFDFAK